jgi:hypothetical protein
MFDAVNVHFATGGLFVLPFAHVAVHVSSICEAAQVEGHLARAGMFFVGALRHSAYSTTAFVSMYRTQWQTLHAVEGPELLWLCLLSIYRSVFHLCCSRSVCSVHRLTLLVEQALLLGTSVHDW